MSWTAAASPWSISTRGWMPRTVKRRLLQGSLGLPVRVLHGGSRPGPVGHVELGAAQRHGQRDEPLLDAVVEVALDPATLGLEGVDEVDPRAAQVGHGLGECGLGRVEQHAGSARPAPDREQR